MRIAIEGNLCTGKTTLAKVMAQYTGFYRLEEGHDQAVDNLFQKYYQRRDKYAFLFQMAMLQRRYHTATLAASIEELKLYPGVIEDRTLIGDMCFAQANYKMGCMTDIEWEIYQKYFRTLRKAAYYPDIVIFLAEDPAVLLDRIAKRGIKEEQDMALSYLSLIDREYKVIFEKLPVPIAAFDSKSVVESTDLVSRAAEIFTICEEIVGEKSVWL